MLVASGLSQMTWMPASRNASATGACRWFGRDDRDGLDAVAARRLGLGHRRVVGVAAVVGQAERERRSAALLGAGRERAGDQLVLVVEPRRHAMHGADEGALAAADHAEPDPPAGPARSALRFDRHGGALQAEHPPGLLRIALPPAKSSNAFSVTRMMCSLDELGALGGAGFGVLQAALPLQHRPAVVVVLRPSSRRSRRNRSGRRRASGSARPAAARAGSPNRRPAGRSGRNSASLMCSERDALVVDVDELEVVELLQQEVRRVVVDAAARMVVHPLEKHLEGDAVEQVLARMQLEGDAAAGLVEGVEDRPPAFGELVESGLDQARRALRPRIEIGPGQRAREADVDFSPRCFDAFADHSICCTAHFCRSFGWPRTASGANASKASS